MENKNGAIKFDSDKLRWDLLPYDCIEELAKIISYGEMKYGEHNWQGVEWDRYFAALMRHLIARKNGELKDPESGLDHLSHVMCNAMFMLWIDKNADNKSKGG